MDSTRIAPERLSWLRRCWRLLTVSADKRCSRCLRRAVVWESFTLSDDERGWIRRTEIRHCLACSHLESVGPHCEWCGFPLWPDFLHLDCGGGE